MVEPSKDPNYSENGSEDTNKDIRDCDKEPEQTLSGDLQNQQQNAVLSAIQDPLHSKDIISIVDETKVESGSKRPLADCPVSPSCEQTPPPNNAATGRLVYVRRKVEVDTGKNITCGSTCIANGSQATTQIKEPNTSSSPTLAPLPKSSMGSPANPSLTLSLGVSGAELTPRDRESSNDQLDWEERYHRLQMLLKKLNESDQKDYVKMLRSLSSIELSRHAVELEKRSIQLSLEEAKEMQRVAALNVLGKSMNKLKSPSTCKDQSDRSEE